MTFLLIEKLRNQIEGVNNIIVDSYVCFKMITVDNCAENVIFWNHLIFSKLYPFPYSNSMIIRTI